MSDHNSGPRALADPVVDITDVYAFPSPDSPAFWSWCSTCFRARNQPRCFPTRSTTDSGCGRSRSPRETAAAFAVGEKEYIVSCRFAVPVEHQDGSPFVQEGTCTARPGRPCPSG